MSMYRPIAIALFLSAQALVAQVSMPSTTRVGIGELQALASRLPDPRKLTEETQGYHPTAMVRGQCMVGFLAKVNGGFDPAAVDANVVRIGARKGNILSFRVDAYHLDAVNDIPGLTYVELAGKVVPTLDRLVKATHADSVQRGINLPQTYTGRNVLIGITDWGFDYTHPMFYDTTLTTSRVRAAWDQWRQAGPAPAAFGYGTELMTPAALLAAQADTANVYSYATHGSHVAGICGGSGAGTQYRGIAFDAQFVFCTFLVDAAAVLDAFTWMQGVADADGKRLVVNMSWGLYYMGTLDGNSLISQAIDQMSLEGVTFSNSAGNNGDVNFHIKKTFAADTLRSRVVYYSYAANPNMWGQSISMWGEPGASFSAGFTIANTSNIALQQSPWYNTATQPAYLDSFMVQGVDTVFFNLTAEAAHPLNGRPYFRLRVKNTSAALHIALKATAPTGTVHFWNVTELSNGVGNWGEDFQAGATGWTAGDEQYGIGEPAVTESLISVAAYSSEYLIGGIPAGGAIAAFSSLGPTMDERMKPDITAPGVSVASSISSFTDNDFNAVTTVNFMGRDYPFARFSGTSMSAPAVTGIVALMLEADPTLTPADIKDIIKTTARTDSHTGTIPVGGSTQWGMGKINAYHAVVQALGLVSVPEVADHAVTTWPNPATSTLNMLADFPAGPVRITVTDMTGRIVFAQQQLTAPLITLDTRTWASGVYSLRLEQQGRM
ncbi:MAG TPA: S8 family serine peptidase, partial [Flavobacteriales bacterium]|nr:S8 family serine peptidase [Flavobacteriales bacterium]